MQDVTLRCALPWDHPSAGTQVSTSPRFPRPQYQRRDSVVHACASAAACRGRAWSDRRLAIARPPGGGSGRRVSGCTLVQHHVRTLVSPAMGRRKRSRIAVVEEEDERRSPAASATPAAPSPATKASRARDEATAAASGERLRAAAQAGRLDELTAALSQLKHGETALDLTDWGGWTALMHAASGDKPELVEQLLKKGASVDVTDVRALCHRDSHIAALPC